MSRDLPHDADSERALLEIAMLGPDTAVEVVAGVEPADMHVTAHRILLGAMRRMVRAGVVVNGSVLAAELRRIGDLEVAGGTAALDALEASRPSAASLGYYVDLVRGLAKRRAVISAARQAELDAYDQGRPTHEILDAIGARVTELAVGRATGEPKSAEDLVRLEVVDYERRTARGDLCGLSTGYLDLDALTGGLCAGDLVLLAARPSVGKTALAVSIADDVALRSQIPALFFSLEMSAHSILHRAVASRGKVDLQRLRRGRVTSDEFQRYARSLEAIKAAPFFVEDSAPLSVLDIRARARRHRQRHGLGLVVVDYLQLVRPSQREKTRDREMAEVSAGLKALAKELAVPVLALSQLNREAEKRQGKRPQLSDLRDSGALEQDADLIMFLSRSEEDGLIDLDVAKHRNGETGDLQLRWTGNYTRFDNAVRGRGAA